MRCGRALRLGVATVVLVDTKLFHWTYVARLPLDYAAGAP